MSYLLLATLKNIFVLWRTMLHQRESMSTPLIAPIIAKYLDCDQLFFFFSVISSWYAIAAVHLMSLFSRRHDFGVSEAEKNNFTKKKRQIKKQRCFFSLSLVILSAMVESFCFHRWLLRFFLPIQRKEEKKTVFFFLSLQLARRGKKRSPLCLSGFSVVAVAAMTSTSVLAI